MATQPCTRPRKQLNRGYVVPESAKINQDLYDRLSASAASNVLKTFTVPAKSGQAWEVKAGQTCRFIVAHGSQVGDVNLWNLHRLQERFYTGKTRQIHRSHLTTYDRLWSNMPYLQPLATVTRDTLQDYGIDEDNCSCHDVIGSRCDPYTHRLMTGELGQNTCHQNLTEAIKPWGLKEEDVHDVFNIFMCSGFTTDTHEYVMRGSPAKVGDYIEILAEVDLLVALSTCPQGDVSVQCGGIVPDSLCHPLDVTIGQPAPEVLKEWTGALNK